MKVDDKTEKTASTEEVIEDSSSALDQDELKISLRTSTKILDLSKYPHITVGKSSEGDSEDQG